MKPPSTPPEIAASAAARFYLAPGVSASLAAEQIRAGLESHFEVSDIELDDQERIVRFKWTGSYLALGVLEAGLSMGGVTVRLVTPMRFEFLLAPRDKTAGRIADAEEALKKAGCCSVAAQPDGSHEAWTTRMVTLKFLKGLRDAAAARNVDLRIRSHEVLAFEGDFSKKKDEARLAAKSVKGTLYIEVEPGKLRILARKDELKEKELQDAFAPLGIPIKRVSE